MRAKVYVACFLLLGLSSAIFSADWATSSGSCYKQGDKNLEIGMPVPFYSFGLHASFDYAFHDAISGGGGLGFQHAWGNGYNYFDFALRGAFHPFNLTVLSNKIPVRDKLDTYVGLVAYLHAGLDNTPDPYVPVWGLIGARWYFTPTISVFLEHCPAFGNLDCGICFKF